MSEVNSGLSTEQVAIGSAVVGVATGLMVDAVLHNKPELLEPVNAALDGIRHVTPLVAGVVSGLTAGLGLFGSVKLFTGKKMLRL